MAGHERRRKVRALLLAEAARELGPNADALDYIEYRISNGTSMRELAAEVTAVLDFIVRATLVEDAAAHGHDPARARERVQAARARGAGGLVEEGKQLIDNVAPERDAIAKAKAQADIRTLIASRWNRGEWGEAPKQITNLNIGNLHIEALRSQRLRQRATVAAEQISEVEEAVVEEITDVMPLAALPSESGM